MHERLLVPLDLGHEADRAHRLDAKLRLLTVVATQADVAAARGPTEHLAAALSRIDIEATPEVVVADDQWSRRCWPRTSEMTFRRAGVR